MRPFPVALLLILLFSNFADPSSGHCDVQRSPSNDLIANCRTLKDARLIATNDLHTLIAVPEQKLLHPKTFQNFSSLTNLNLSKGKIKKIELATFSKLSHLETLNLEHNSIRTLKLGTFKGLIRLQSLSLGDNSISKLSQEILNLRNLRYVNLTRNPLDCNCVSLKIRDALVRKGVTISKGSSCSSPSTLKGIPFSEPLTDHICDFEKQDKEMLMDEAVTEGSGDEEDDYKEDDDSDYKDEDQVPSSSTTVGTSEVPETTSPETATSEIPSSSVSPVTTTQATSEAPGTSDDSLILIDSSSVSPVTTTLATSEAPRAPDDSLILIDDSKESDLLKPPAPHLEGSGEIIKVPVDETEDGSGDDEGSGTGLPHIDWPQIQEETKAQTEATEPSSTTGDGLLENLSNIPNRIFDMFSYFGTLAPEVKKETTEVSSTSYLEEEEFISISTSEPISVEKEVTTKIDTTTSTTSTTTLKTGDDVSERILTNDVNLDTNEVEADVSQSRQSKKSMGSYFVLAALLTVLTCLIAYAAYKGDLCKSKKKRSDVENGTELKDLQKSLLDASTVQPKIANNGNAEIVPLVSEKPVENFCETRNSADNLRFQDVNEPAKPPRRSMQMEDFEGVRTNGNCHQDLPGLVKTYLTEPKNLSSDDVGKPPVSPGAQRVKITLQEIPDSVPKTPILITRLQNDGNLVKTP